MSKLLKSSIFSLSFLFLLVFATACANSTPGGSPTLIPMPLPQLAPPKAQIPAFSHVYLIVMENKEYPTIVGNPALPYINQLIERYGLATNYHALAHPSQPNYLALFSGSTQGVQDDGVHQLDAPNLADQLEQKGKTWRFYEQNIRPSCYTGETSATKSEGTGLYMRTHNPAISFTSISESPARCANIQEFAQFDPAAANFEFIAPDSCSDMHDCEPPSGDQFLSTFVPKIINSPAWQENSVLFITWDEGTTDEGGGGHIPLIVVSNLVPKDTKSNIEHDHYSLLRTIQDAWGLECLQQSCSANNLGEFFP